jgi:hypothetical protein
MSIADDWRHLGAGSAMLQEIERKAAADGIELLFGEVADQRGDDWTGSAVASASNGGSNHASCEFGSAWTTQPGPAVPEVERNRTRRGARHGLSAGVFKILQCYAALLACMPGQMPPRWGPCAGSGRRRRYAVP